MPEGIDPFTLYESLKDLYEQPKCNMRAMKGGWGWLDPRLFHSVPSDSPNRLLPASSLRAPNQYILKLVMIHQR